MTKIGLQLLFYLYFLFCSDLVLHMANQTVVASYEEQKFKKCLTKTNDEIYCRYEYIHAVVRKSYGHARLFSSEYLVILIGGFALCFYSILVPHKCFTRLICLSLPRRLLPLRNYVFYFKWMTYMNLACGII